MHLFSLGIKVILKVHNHDFQKKIQIPNFDKLSLFSIFWKSQIIIHKLAISFMKIGDSLRILKKLESMALWFLNIKKNKKKWLLPKLNTLPTLIYTYVFMKWKYDRTTIVEKVKLSNYDLVLIHYINEDVLMYNKCNDVCLWVIHAYLETFSMPCQKLHIWTYISSYKTQ